MHENATVSDVSWALHQDALRSIRDRVFVDEQEIAPDTVYDEKDPDSTHFLLSEGEQLLACGRLQPDGKIGRMAVLPEYRGQGLGRRLLDGIVHYGRHKGYRRLYLHAQSHAAEFYAAAGFEQFGEEFEEADIPHVAMEMHVDYRGASDFISGVEYPEPFATLAVELVKSGRRHLRIYSHRLDHEVFDTAELAEDISGMSRRGRYS